VANLEANTQEIRRFELEIGGGEVAEATMQTWLGAEPAEDDRPIVETVIEAYQLGLAIHRREEFDGAETATR
jgi:hypothetical protein